MRSILIEILVQEDARYCHGSCPFLSAAGGRETDAINGVVAHCRLFDQSIYGDFGGAPNAVPGIWGAALNVGALVGPVRCKKCVGYEADRKGVS